MNPEKIGALIYALRKERGLTQRALAATLHVTDKTISKWECGGGCPDVSLLPELADVFGVRLEVLLSGELDENARVGGNMKKLKFYFCPHCGNLITASAEAAVSCCGKVLSPMTAVKAAEEDRLSVEKVEHDYFITAAHPMTKDHYISFVALLTGDAMMLKRQYPEWDLQTRIPQFGRGMLVWHCTKHGLFYQLVG